ncbi:MAG TPA: hypothetical protein VGM88_22515 [Kofleriaceae bacterium]|jgi:hypothetical protein
MRAAWLLAAALAACGGSHSSSPDGGHGSDAMVDSLIDGAPDAMPDAQTAFTVGGMVHGLAGGTLVVDNNHAEQLSITADGAFAFPTTLANGAAYTVTIGTDGLVPVQDCTVIDATGAVTGADVTNIDIECTAATTWASVTAGYARTCGIQTDGSLFCWEFTPHAVAPGTTWKSISLNGVGVPALGLHTDGTLWGFGQGDNPAQIGTVIWRSIETSTSEGCGIETDGTLGCFSGPLLSTDTDWASVAGSSDSDTFFAIRTDGSLWWWGHDDVGDLTFAPGPASAPTPEEIMTGGAPWAQVTLAETQACGVRTDGTLWCWGHGGAVDADLPTQVGTDSDWVEVKNALLNVCARKQDGTVWCLGDGHAGALGNGTLATSTTLVQAGTAGFTSISVGWNGDQPSVACGVRGDQTIQCWGGGEDGGLGIWPKATGPVRIDAARSFAQLAVPGDRFANDAFDYLGCGIMADASLSCWSEYEPVHPNLLEAVAPGQTWTSIAAADVGVDAIRSDRTWWHVGRDLTLTEVSSDAWVQIAPQHDFTCALASDGTRWCEGENLNGVFGNGTSDPIEPPPVQHPLAQIGTDTWLALTTQEAGVAGACGIHSDHTLWCWGLFGASMVPVQIGTAADYTKIAAGLGDMLALHADGTLSCLGDECTALGSGATYTTLGEVTFAPGPWVDVTDGGILDANGAFWELENGVTQVPGAWAALSRSGNEGAIGTNGAAWTFASQWGLGNGTGYAYVPTRIAL